MKKLILPAFCLALGLASVNAVAVNTNASIISVSFNDDRHVVKSEELPDGVKKTLASDAYKGWVVKEAAVVNTPAATKADDKAVAATSSYYEVILTNEKETKTVKFHQDGSLLN